MTKLLDEAIAEIRKLPDAEQDRAAALLLALAQDLAHEQDDDAANYRLTPEQVAQVRLGLEQARRGEFVPEEEVEEMWRQFGR
ncbi:hypothetical protein [Xanthobacter aminoxidans]|uniref:hypothetical protein n=1 Tax=Xanthobacter aminoxidans TaxID=186280 RepID=UPI002022FB31|nr:hypothetical protein [Xanthobacter aminoxidans]MCL8382418.1 hypothetical protein [Xanthobacter aminoxidans]